AGEILEPCLERRCQRLKPPGPHRVGQGGPARLRVSGRGNRASDVLRGAGRDRGKRFAGRRIEYIQPAAWRWLDGLACDPVRETHDRAQGERVRPRSTGRLMPLMQPAAGEHRKATAAAVSSGRAKRRSGTLATISSNTACSLRPPRCARVRMICSIRGVSVKPGNTLLTVMPSGPSSQARVLAQAATAQRAVFETPSPLIGSFTEVEMMLTMRP